MKVYTVEEVSDTLKVHPNTVRKILERGEIPYFKVGDQYRVSEWQLEQYIQTHSFVGGAPVLTPRKWTEAATRRMMKAQPGKMRKTFSRADAYKIP